MASYNVPDLRRRAFAKTNPTTVVARVALLRELHPGLRSVGELCCGDCAMQARAYTAELGIERFCDLDVLSEIVELNRARGIDCVCGDVLDSAVLRQFLDFEVLFFGPPLSLACDAHRLLAYDEVLPPFEAVGSRLFNELGYQGTWISICPRGTTLGDARRLYDRLRVGSPDLGLRLIHRTWSTVTGGGEVTEPRLKYVELWFSRWLGDAWEVRESGRPGAL